SLSLINAPGGFPDINQVGIVTCFFKNGELFFSKVEDCEPMVLGILQSTLNKVNVTTLIKEGECKISNAENIQSIEIFDLNGRKLKDIKTFGEKELNI